MKKLLNRIARTASHGEMGFTLLEMAIVLMVISLLFVFVLPTSSTILNNRKNDVTQQKIKNIESAIANYVAVNKRLPCPADGTMAPGTAGAGIEGARNGNQDCANNQVSGVVPWVTLGLTQTDIEDGWDRRITYRAAFSLTRDNALDMSMCDPAGTKVVDNSGFGSPPGGRCFATCVGTDMTTCTSPQNYLNLKGFDVRDGSGNLIMTSNPVIPNTSYTGAAYIVISHGGNGYGSYNRYGTFVATAATGVAGTIEAFNINGPAVSVSNGVPTSAATFRDTDFSAGAAATYFDDIILRPSVFTLIQRAQIGPRSH